MFHNKQMQLWDSTFATAIILEDTTEEMLISEVPN
jgi:hypothetical protein